MTQQYLTRFAGIARLYGYENLRRLAGTRVWIAGLGGVGSWACEALARAGIGHFRLIDGDCVSETNINRQLCALSGTLGKAKAEVLAGRFREINPFATVEICGEFIDKASAGTLFDNERPDIFVDAIDGALNKAALVAACKNAGVPVVSSGGCAGKRNGFCVETADLSRVENDGLLKCVRKTLRTEYNFPKAGAPMCVPCVFSREIPQILDEKNVPEIISPANGRPRAGSASWVTGAFGLALAQLAVDRILAGTREA